MSAIAAEPVTAHRLTLVRFRRARRRDGRRAG
jgi:hypothetical protein